MSNEIEFLFYIIAMYFIKYAFFLIPIIVLWPILYLVRHPPDKKIYRDSSNNPEFNRLLEEVCLSVAADFRSFSLDDVKLTNVMKMSQFLSENDPKNDSYDKIVDLVESHYRNAISFKECVARVSEIHRKNIEFFLKTRMAA